MIKLNLEKDETILLQTTEVERFGKTEIFVDEMILTNKKIVMAYKKRNSLFSKSENIIGTLSLDKIKVVNSIPQVMKVDNADYGLGLQILYNNGDREHFVFCDDKKELDEWFDVLISTIREMNDANVQENNDMIYEEVGADNVKSNDTLKVDDTNSRNNKPLIYCTNCGNKLDIAAKFCSECGTSVADAYDNDQNINNHKEASVNVDYEEEVDRAEFMDNEEDSLNNKEEHNVKTDEHERRITKCPACGEILAGFIAICPACGYEVKSDGMPESVKRFIEEIDKCEKAIARDPSKGYGWQTWGLFKKIGWVLLNIITCCIPLLIYFIVSLLKVNATPNLNKSEKDKVALIKNYTFPNERDSIINALLFIKAKTSFLVAEKTNNKSPYWMKVWDAKADHLYNKAQLLFPNDSVVEAIYMIIKENKDTLEKATKKRAIVGICVAVIVIAVFFVPRIVDDSMDAKEQKLKYEKQYDWEEILLNDKLPEPSSTFGDISDNSADRLYMAVYKISNEEFKEYVKECKMVGYTIVDTNTETIYRAYNDERVFIDISYSDYNDENSMNILVELPEEIVEINWPDTSLVKKIPKPKKLVGYIASESSDLFNVYIDNVSNDEFNQYINECIEKGFDNDYNRSEEYFHGEDNEGNSLTVEHEEFNVMSISVRSYDFWD